MQISYPCKDQHMVVNPQPARPGALAVYPETEGYCSKRDEDPLGGCCTATVISRHYYACDRRMERWEEMQPGRDGDTGRKQGGTRAGTRGPTLPGQPNYIHIRNHYDHDTPFQQPTGVARTKAGDDPANPGMFARSDRLDPAFWNVSVFPNMPEGISSRSDTGLDTGLVPDGRCLDPYR